VTAFIEFNEPAAFRICFLATMVLKGCQHVAIRQANISVRMHVAIEIAEESSERGLSGISQTEQHGLPLSNALASKKPPSGISSSV